MDRLAAAYAAGVVGWNALRLTPLTRWAPFEVADLFAWFLYVPIPLMVLGLLVSRRWKAPSVFVLPVLIFAVEYGPQFLPNRTPTGDAVRFLTANLYSRNTQFEAVSSTVAASGAEVVALQELDIEMSKRLSSQYPYAALYPAKGSEGLGLLSRYPIIARQPPALTRGSCRCQMVRFSVKGREFLVINAHPHRPNATRQGFGTSHQEAAVEAIIEQVRSTASPVVVVGDLNIADRHPLYRKLRGVLGDSHRDAGWGLGLTWAHRARLLLVRIDYVFHDEQWGARHAVTGSMPGSDHRYVAAELVLR